MATLRRQGVFGYNLPPQVGNVVLPALFGMIGVIGRFARGISSVLEINQLSEVETKLGSYKSGFLGRYVVESIFANLKGQPCKVYARGYVATDAVQAYSTLADTDGSPENTLKIKAAYTQLTDKSADGNNTGYTLIYGSRFSTAISATALLSATSIQVDSVAGLRAGDVLKITSTGPAVHYTKVSAIDEQTKTLTVSALTNAVADDDTVEAMGFKITCYRKNKNGIAVKVSIPENDIYLSMEPENTEFYVNTAFANHPYIDLEDLSSTSVLFLSWPAAVSTTTFLASGSDGTAPTTTNHWDLYSSFDNKNIRFLLNSDTYLEGVNKAGEVYCTSRLDTPIWMYQLQGKRTKAQLVVLGNTYQRSDQVQGVICASYRNVTDPIGVGSNPVVSIPIHGAITGSWVRTFYTLGFHRSPAGDDVPIYGFVTTSDATEDNFTEDERTDICNAGVNIIQDIPGRGLILRSFYTPSTNIGALFGHYLLMQNFIKISSTESLYKVENRPNRLSAIQGYGDAIKDFGRKLFRGSYPYGIDTNGAFGEFTLSDGNKSKFEDVFIVQADQFNNPNSSIAIGEANVLVRFVPAPNLGSLAIGVGVLIPV